MYCLCKNFHPNRHFVVISSLLEQNTWGILLKEKSETQWNTEGITSGKSRPQWKKEKNEQVLSNMAKIIRAAIGRKSNLKQHSLKKGDMNLLDRAKLFSKEEKKVEVSVETEEEIQKRRDKNKEDAEKLLSEKEAKVKFMEQEIIVAETEMLQITALLQKETEKTAILKKQFREVKDTIELVKNAVENTKELQSSIEGLKSKLIDWQGKWESVRSNLIEEYRTIKFSFSKREEELLYKREAIQKTRAEIKLLVQQSKEKDARYKDLVKNFKEIQSQEKRSTYTAKILALVSTVKKYRVEINSILVDTKIVQKEINALSDTLSRLFADTEQLIFDEVEKEKDKATTDSYKSLAKLDTTVKEMVDLISKTGSTQNQTLQLSEKN